MNELDIVLAVKNLSKSVHCGSIGTIVMVYDNPRVAYEVEFFDEEGETLELLTVEKDDIKLKQKIG